MTEQKKLIDRKAVAQRIGCTERHTVNLEKTDDFPRKIRIGKRRFRWEADEIEEWLESRRVSA